MVEILLTSPTLPKQIATAMKKHIRETGGEATHTECLKLCANMFGYESHSLLMSAIESFEGSTPDGYVSLDILGNRVLQYLAQIELRGFTRSQAWNLICDVKAGPWLGIGRFMDQSP
jgi:hypothetical protein